MWDRNLVSRLSSKAAQVLLSLLLTREIETQQTAAEFAKTTGLGQRSIAPALLELRDAGLIQIIPQPGKPSIVRLVHPELASATQVGEYRYETTITEASGPVLERMDQAQLPAHKRIDGETDGKAEGVGEEGAGRGLIEQCRKFDAWTGEGKRDLQIAALQDVWDYAFPVGEYPDPTQRMSNGFAQRLLAPPGQVNRSAEWVGEVVLDSVQHATSHIQSPRAYIQKAVDMEEKRKGPRQESGQSISDDLRRLVELGKEQFGAKSKDGPGDKP